MAVFFSCLFWLLSLQPVPAYAISNIIYVDASASGANNGTSWSDAYTDFQDGIDNAISGDEVWVADGVYLPSSSPNIASPATARYFHFSLKNGVAVYGGFAGTESSKAERNPELNETILSGDIGTEDDFSDNCYHVFFHPSGLGLNATAVLDTVTIMKGNANNGSDPNPASTYPHNNGGGMYNHDNSPTIRNCLFESNRAENGGGLYNWASSPTISNTYFGENIAMYTYARGGGMWNQNGAPIITSCTFYGNQAKSGGGIYNYFSSPIITASTFDTNDASSAGGGIYNSFSPATMTNCTFFYNILSGPSSYDGGAVSNYHSASVMTNCTLSDNEGLGYTNTSCESGTAPTTTVKNSILWGSEFGEIYLYGCYNSPSVTVTYSAVSGGYTGTGNTALDPGLYPGGIANNGGPVDTIAIDDSGSAYNAGTTSGAPATDARGLTRDGQPDMGAYEVINYELTPSISGGNGSISPSNVQEIPAYGTTQFTLVPDTGYHSDQVTGTCGGTLVGDTFTTDPITANCTVIGSFAINTYTVNSSVSGGNGTIDPSGDQVVYHGDTPSFNLIPAAGYHIDQVTGTCGGNLVGDTFTTDPVTGGCTVVASFAINTYTVNSSVSGGNGTIDPSGDQVVNHGDTPSFTLTPATGYHIDAIQGTCGGNLVGDTFTTDPVTANCTVVAVFSDTYTVTSSVSGIGGTVNPLGPQTVNFNDTPSFTLTPDSHYHVASVTGTCGGNLVGNIFTTNPITISCTVIANFTIDTYTVTSSVSGGNGTITPEGFQTVDYNATPSFDLTPDTGYHVDQVTGTCGGILSGNTYTTNPVTANCTVIGSFSDTYTLQVLFQGSGTGTITSSPAGIDCTDDCDAEFTDGQEVTLAATPDAEMTFLGWSGEGCTGTGNCIITLDQAREVTATFSSPCPWNLFLPAILGGIK